MQIESCRGIGTKRENKIRNFFFLFLLGMATLLIGTLPAFAALGGDISSVQADRVQMNAGIRVTQKGNYSVHELRTPTGMVVREFASPSGKIFAVAWQGPWAPDLQHLLGSHYEEFQQALHSQSRPPGHGPVSVHRPGLVVELGGHMRFFIGRAYLPDETPSGIRMEEIH